MGDYSVKAVLSAVDKGFTSAMNSAQSVLDSFSSKISSGIGFGFLTSMGSSAFSAISSGFQSCISGAVETSDSIDKLKKSMDFSGQYSGADEINSIVGGLKDYADETIFELQDVTSTFGALSANGIKDADKMTEAVGNAVAVYGGGAQEFSSVGLAFSQAMALGALHAQDWNQIINASPQLAGGLRKELIKLNPALGEDFKGAMEDGAISADMLGQAMSNIGMTDAAKEAATTATTMEGAMGQLKVACESGVMGIYDSFAKSGLVDVINKFSDSLGKGFDWISEKIPAAISTITPYIDILKSGIEKLSAPFKEAGTAIKTALDNIGGGMGSVQSQSGFQGFVDGVVSALTGFANFCKDHATEIAQLIKILPKVIAAFLGFKVVAPILSKVISIGQGIGSVVSGVGGFIGKLTGATKKLPKSGEEVNQTSSSMSAGAKNIAGVGAGIALAAAGIWLLADAAIRLSTAGPAASVILIGLAAGMTVMMAVVAKMAPQLPGAASGLIALGAAILLAAAGMALMAMAATQVAAAGPLAVAALAIMVGGMIALVAVLAALGPGLTAAAPGLLALGAAILLAAAGMALMSLACVSLAAAGPGAISAFQMMVISLIAIVAVFALLGPVLTASAVGFIAFGIAILAVGVGALLAAAALAIVAAVLPTIVAYGLQGAVAIVALGAAMIVFAAGATLAGAGALILGAGLLVAGAGALVFGAALLVVDAAVIVLMAITALLGAALLLVSASATLAGASMMIASAGATFLFAGFTLLLATSLLLSASLALLNAPVLLIGVSALIATAGIAAFGAAIGLSAIGAGAMAVALVAVSTCMSSIASDASSAESSLNNMESAVNVVSDGLKALGDLAASALEALTSAFTGAEKNVVSAAKDLVSGVTNVLTAGMAMLPGIALIGMNGFASGINAGGQRAISIAASISNSVANALGSAAGSAYSMGAYIGSGLANGLASQAGAVAAQAASLAASASAAIAAKAQIHSPSKVSTRQGKFIGEGLGLGIKAMGPFVKKQSEKLFSIPSLDNPNLGMSMPSTQELNRNYNYNPAVYVNAEVTSVMDGREVGRGSAKYVKEQNDFTTARRSRIGGVAVSV